MKLPACPSCHQRLPETSTVRIVEQDRREGWLFTAYTADCPCGATVRWGTKEGPG